MLEHILNRPRKKSSPINMQNMLIFLNNFLQLLSQSVNEIQIESVGLQIVHHFHC